VYTVLGTRVRLADRFNDTPLTLSGTAYMERATHFERGEPLALRWDLEAITWLQDNVQGSPVVLEAHNEQYRWGPRMANYTGLPTVLGWPWHQIQQRTPYRSAIADRARDIAEIYNTRDRVYAEELLRRYEVEYVVVGELERVYYDAAGLEKFDYWVGQGAAKLAYQNPAVSVYQIAW
jgi:uncharacterized membrane protein